MILALLLAAAQPATVSDDDRVFRIGGQTHILRMRLQSDYFGNPANRARLDGAEFAPACAAHFLALRRIEPRYSERFRPFVIQAVRTIVPTERLAAAPGSPMSLDHSLVAWWGRVYEDVQGRAASVLTSASADHQRLADEEMLTRHRTWPESGDIDDRARMTATQLATACAVYFGNNREAILAMERVEETH